MSHSIQRARVVIMQYVHINKINCFESQLCYHIAGMKATMKEILVQLSTEDMVSIFIVIGSELNW